MKGAEVSKEDAVLCELTQKTEKPPPQKKEGRMEQTNNNNELNFKDIKQ
jgi:hypothetical protein